MSNFSSPPAEPGDFPFLVNGDMRIDQRNAGVAQTFTNGAAVAYSVDRFYGSSVGANITGQRVAGTGADQYL
ncbi:MAG: hypothetical protein JNK06_18570 [Candidatus Accumulibacter phosphatis]|nr:hypothetical protein [Candidatus Accumulibacter phosphatis]